MSTKREDQLENAFLEGGIAVPGIKMRPFSLGTLNLCKKLKLSMFISDGEREELNDDDSLEQLITFAWMQSAPLPDVLAAVRTDKWRDAVELFAFDLSTDTITALTGEVDRIAKQSNAAAVEVIAKPRDKSEEEGAPPKS